MEEIFGVIFDPSNRFYQVTVALLLGFFIGLRRQALSTRKDVDGTDMMGIRTTSLFVVLGTVVTFFADIPYVFIIMFGGILILLIIAYANGVFRLNRYGLTSEVSALIMFFIGVLIGQEQIILAILLAIMLGISSAYKKHIHSFANTFSLREWSGALQLLVISALVLPLLPKEAVDPFGIFIPFDMWILVILISSIGFIGYFFSKYFGEKKSVLLTSFFGALVSSTATTITLAEKSKKPHAHDTLLSIGVMIAIAVMQVRVIVEVFLLTQEVHQSLLAAAVAMTVMSLLLAGLYYLYLRKIDGDDDICAPEMRSPFEIVPALKFAAFFTIILFAIYFSQEYLGDIGAYITAFLASFADVDAVIFSALISLSGLNTTVAIVGNIISIAVVVNTVVKLFYIALFGSRTFLKVMTIPLLLIVTSGIIAAITI